MNLNFCADISQINWTMISSTHHLYLGSLRFNLIYSYSQWNEASSCSVYSTVKEKNSNNYAYVCVHIALSMRLCPRDFRLPNYYYAKTKAILFF